MTVKGLSLLKNLEGFRNHPYLDNANPPVPTIGYGNTFYTDGTRVTMADPPISRKDATALLLKVVAKFEKGVRKHVQVYLEPHQWDALISFTYNVGAEAFRTSTLLKVVNNDPQDYFEIERQMKRWNKSGGRINNGLITRRAREFQYYGG